MGEFSRREFIGKSSLFIPVLGLDSLVDALQENTNLKENAKKPRIDKRIDERITQLEAKLKAAKTDSEKATAHHNLAEYHWNKAENNKDHTEALAEYTSAMIHADSAQKLTLKADKMFEGLEERLGRCYLIAGTGLMRTESHSQGLESLRKSLAWSESQKTKERAADEIFNHYAAGKIYNIAREFRKGNHIKQPLIKRTYEHLANLTGKNKTPVFVPATKEEQANVLNMFRQLSFYIHRQEMEKSRKNRDHWNTFDPLFKAYTIYYALNNSKEIVINGLNTDFAVLKKSYDNVPELPKFYDAWQKRVKDHPSRTNDPGTQELLKALNEEK